MRMQVGRRPGPPGGFADGGAQRAARMRRSNGSKNCFAIFGEVAEWSNALAWKASRRDERLGSSNLPLSGVKKGPAAETGFFLRNDRAISQEPGCRNRRCNYY